MKNNLLSFFSLFGSTASLVCCALPALLVSLGAGATLVGLISVFPQLVWISQHSSTIFILVGAILLLTGLLRHLTLKQACPLPSKAKNCQQARDYSAWAFRASVVIYLIGFFFSFVAPTLI